MDKENRNKLLNTIAIVIAIFLVIGLVFVFFIDRNNEPTQTVDDDAIYINRKKYKLNNDPEIVLAVGLDSYGQKLSEGYMNNQMADFIYILVIDKEKGEITPIQINRDSMVRFNVLGVRGDIVDEKFGQVALSHSYGDGGLTSLCNVKDAVSNLFYGIHIDYYISLTMDAIPIINDELGGVKVNVKDNFEGIDDSIIQGEECVLHGESALNFVRARSGMDDSTNLARMNRQREYLTNMYKSFIEMSKNDDMFAPNTLEKVGDYLVSSANINDLQQLIKLAREFKLNDTLVLEGEAIKGETYIEYYIDDNSLTNIAINTILQEIK